MRLSPCVASSIIHQTAAVQTSLPISRTFHPRLTGFAVRHPRWYLLAYGIVSAALVLVLVWAFAEIADAVPEQGRLVRFDEQLTAFIQSHDTEWGEALFQGVSYLGPPLVYVAIAAGVLYFARSRDWLRAATVLASGAGGVVLNNVLKSLFHRGRPESAIEFIHNASWSFPSGHAMDTITTYGILLVLARESMRPGPRRKAIVGAIALAIAIVGYSRLYLGVHYLSDVVGGWLAGGAWLIACVSGYHFARSALGHSALAPDREQVLAEHLARENVARERSA
jgi:undecaprenyl-diphosphatase